MNGSSPLRTKSLYTRYMQGNINIEHGNIFVAIFPAQVVIQVSGTPKKPGDVFFFRGLARLLFAKN